MYIQQLYTNCLAEAAYYIESDGEAAVIDPLRETDPYIDLAKGRGALIKYVFETHFHADFVSGHLDLSKKVKAPIVYGPDAYTRYKVYNAKDGEEFRLGRLTIKVLHTPGHTPESSCYLLLDENKKPYALFSGDTLFVGDVGRPDLLDGVMSRETLASMMYDSLNNKIKSLPDDVIVYPAHGPGSACGKNIGKETFSTIGKQKKFNYALKDMSREAFIEKVTEGILPPPSYFLEDVRINKNGYAPLEEVIARNAKQLTVAEVRQAIDDGALVLDTRKADDFAKGFIPGSLNIGLNGQFAVWVGTLISIQQPIVLITEEGKQNESILRLARVGYENVLGYMKDGVHTWNSELETVQSVTAEEMKTEFEKGTKVIDVRKSSEWNVAHLKNAMFLPLAGFPDNLKELDKTQNYLVHCAGGYRSMTAISIMKQLGFQKIVNVSGGFGTMQTAGLPIVTEENAAAQ